MVKILVIVSDEILDRQQKPRTMLFLSDEANPYFEKHPNSKDFAITNRVRPVMSYSGLPEELRRPNFPAVKCLHYIESPFLVRSGRNKRTIEKLHQKNASARRTKKTEAQTALKESEEKYRTLVENANDGIIIVQDGIVVYSNPMMAKLNGTTPEDIVGTSIFEHIYYTDIMKMADRYKRRRAGESVPNSYEATLKRANGDPAPTEINVGSISYRGKPAELAIIRDITERKRLENEVRRSHEDLERRVKERTAELEISRERFKNLVELLPEGVFEMNADGRFLYANRTTLDIFQWASEDITKGIYLQEIAAPRVLAKIRKDMSRLESGRTMEAEYTVHRKDNTEFPVLIRAGATKHTRKKEIRGIIVDLTERHKAQADNERLENQLRQTQKMEALGTMAGGIAHDFNNILAAIIGFTEMVLGDLPPESPISSNLEKINRSALRGRDLIKQMLAFSRKDSHVKKLISIRNVVDDTANLVRASTPTTIEIRWKVDNESSVILADPVQIHQVILNLCNNAADVMQAGGILGIRFTDYYAQRDNIVPGLRKGPYVLMSVSDTGKGIDPDIQERIFEPFFTTKSKGRGTGLGLSVVHGIVTGHGGIITVNSQPGIGTTFDIYLPKKISDTNIVTKEDHKIKRGEERILLVDDEEYIIYTQKKNLESLGYKVTATTSSIEALDIFKNDPDSFDIIVSDQTMPEMTGLQLFKAIQEIKMVPFILLTGFSYAVNYESAKSSGIDTLLMKPFTRQELSKAIRDILDKI